MFEGVWRTTKEIITGAGQSCFLLIDGRVYGGNNRMVCWGTYQVEEPAQSSPLLKAILSMRDLANGETPFGKFTATFRIMLHAELQEEGIAIAHVFAEQNLSKSVEFTLERLGELNIDRQAGINN